MIAELRFNRSADLIDLHAEGRVGEGTQENLAFRPTQIAALRRGSGIPREFLANFAKSSPACALQNTFRLKLYRGIVLRIADRQQDVAHSALLGLHKALRGLGLLFIVVSLELRLIDADFGGQPRLNST